MKHEKLEGVDYDPYTPNSLTDRAAVEARRRHALEDARREHFKALNNLMDGYDEKIVAIHSHFDAMSKAVAA